MTGQKIDFVRNVDVYPDFPSHMNQLGKFVYLRTYSRYLNDKGRREVFKETIHRATNFNIGLEYKYRIKAGLPINMKKLMDEADLLFHNQFNLKQFLAGRTLWVGGADTGVGDKFTLSNFNCSFVNIKSWHDLCDMFYLLLVGTGVGFRCTKENAMNLPKIRVNTKQIHRPYNPKPKENRLERSSLIVQPDKGLATLEVGDSKEGWVEALRMYLGILTRPEFKSIRAIEFIYDSVRPRGERLKTFGGQASGPEPLREMFEGFDKVLKNQMDPYLDPIEVDSEGYGHVRPIHILDMGNLIGYNVVVGGKR